MSPTFIDFKAGDEVVETVAHEGADFLMWEAAGLFLEDHHNKSAGGLSFGVWWAISEMRQDPNFFRLYNHAVPGATTYESVLDFLEKLEGACEDYPYTLVKIRN